MNALLVALAVAAAPPSSPTREQQQDAPTVVVVVGAQGTEAYGKQFETWAKRWRVAAEGAGARVYAVGWGRDLKFEISDFRSQSPRDREQLKSLIERECDSNKESDLWIVLIGHGTDNGRDARFNLRGPDVTAKDLKRWLAGCRRPTAIVNCTSASGAFVKTLAGPNRVVVTATKSGQEHNFARFGDYLSTAVAANGADLDKDGQTSLMEAWLLACRRTQEFYKTEGRLATEHSLLDDNGDGAAVRANDFRGLRHVKPAAGDMPADGHRAHQFHLVSNAAERNLPPEWRRRRDQLEFAVIQLRAHKEEWPADEYFTQLEALLVQLAEHYETAAPPAVAESTRLTARK